MRYLPLLWAGIFRRKARAILTLLSVVVAFLLFGVGMVTKGAESLGTGIRQFRSGFRDDESREEANKGEETSTGEEPR